MEEYRKNNNLIWKIEDMDQLIDTFRNPMPSKDFKVKDKTVAGWPSFHASEADPDGEYMEYKYSVYFEMEDITDSYLHIACIVSTPRIPDLKIMVNGVCGNYYPYPAPSKDKEIKPSHALHAAIYNREDAFIYLPASLFHKGTNCMSFIAMDKKPVKKIKNEQAVLRLDRMADACGFHYGALELYKANGNHKANQCEIFPSVIYVKDKKDRLVEKCFARFDNLNIKRERAEGFIELTWNNTALTIPYSFEVPAFGQVKLPFLLPDGEGAVHYKLEGDLMGSGELKRKRKWNVYTTPHAHTDIGYTHRQWEVAERMCRNIDTALDLLHGDYADSFSYIIDSTWHLEEYLNSRSTEQKEKLIAAVRKGRLGIPLNYVDLLTWLPSLEALIHNGDYTASVLGPYGLKADRADIVDVASATGSYPAVLKGSGVKYLLHADNQDRGPFRFNGGLHRHSPFWWKAPDGSKILTWLARMYCELKKVCGSPASKEAAETGLEMWLMDYEREDYIPDAVILYGQEADNTDMDTRTAAFLAEWGKDVVYPKLIPSNGSSFFEYVEQFSDRFKEYSGDEGAYWEDGAASSVLETFAVRQADAGIRCAEILDSLAMFYEPQLRFPFENYQEAWKQVLLYEEHTWGAFLSGSDPDSLLQMDQWAVKSHMASQAIQWKNRLLTQAATRISLMWNNESREIVVYNPYSFPVQGYVTVEFAKGETIYDTKGIEAGWEEISRTKTQVVAKLWVEPIQSFSYRRYLLRKEAFHDLSGKYQESAVQGTASIENRWYTVSIDTESGSITSFYDKELNRELCSGTSFGKVLYARGGEGTTLLGNRPGLSREGAEMIPCFSPVKAVRKISAVGSSIILSGTAVLGNMEVVYTLPNNEKNLCLEYRYEKDETEELEAVYVDLPFHLSECADVLSDSQIGWVDWQKDVLPGACREWLPLQTSILIRDDQCDVQIASPDAFLFTVGTPVKGQWISDLETRGNHIYSYVLNNYWRVNYKGKQGGKIRFRYYITSDRSIPFEQAYRFGWIRRQGLIAQRMSYQEFRKDVPKVYQDPRGGSLLKVHSNHIVVSTIRGSKDGEGFIIRLQETGGYSGDIEISFGERKLAQLLKTDHQERPIEKIHFIQNHLASFHLNPWEVATYKIILRKA